MIKNYYRFYCTIFLCFLASWSFSAIPKDDQGELVTSLAPLVNKVAPAVVNIRVSQTVRSRSPYDDEIDDDTWKENHE